MSTLSYFLSHYGLFSKLTIHISSPINHLAYRCTFIKINNDDDGGGGLHIVLLCKAL